MSVSAQSLQPTGSRLWRRAESARARGETAKAERLYNAVLQREAANFDALHGLGLIHYGRGRVDTALVLFQEALKANPWRADGFASLGLAFHALRRFKEALRSYDEGLRLRPRCAELLSRRGVALLELRRADEALADFEAALAADPDHRDALGNLGNALLKLNRPEQALAIYDRALRLVADNARLLTNRAVALRRLDRPREALLGVSRALAADPDLAQARFVEALVRLTLGDFAAGWRGYEARWGVGALALQRRSFAAPLWRGGEPLDGKTILLHAEQGFGDTIQFVRYAPLVAARGANVILEVQGALTRLVGPLPGIAVVIGHGEPLPPFDYHCPLLSLPLAFGTDAATIPADIPYLAPFADDVAAWRARLPQGQLLVGVAWSGERLFDNDRNRSVPLAALAPLFDVPGVQFVSLQHDVRDEDAPFLDSGAGLLPIGQAFRDFADTAAAISAIDVVISVDTAVAHLAGAMGRPLFLLLPFAADFRWLRERDDSPWYPTARLFRQQRFDDWAGAVEAVRGELMRLIRHSEMAAKRPSKDAGRGPGPLSFEARFASSPSG